MKAACVPNAIRLSFFLDFFEVLRFGFSAGFVEQVIFFHASADDSELPAAAAIRIHDQWDDRRQSNCSAPISRRSASMKLMRSGLTPCLAAALSISRRTRL